MNIFNCDCLDLMRSLDEVSVDLIITSPPYNMGKEYEGRLSIDDYLSWQGEVIKESYRVLKNGGSICWQVGNWVDNGVS